MLLFIHLYFTLLPVTQKNFLPTNKRTIFAKIPRMYIKGGILWHKNILKLTRDESEHESRMMRHNLHRNLNLKNQSCHHFSNTTDTEMALEYKINRKCY